MTPDFAFVREWPPQDQAAGLVDLTLALHEAMSTRGREAEAQALIAEVRAYLDVLSPLAEAEAPSAAPEAAEEPAPPFARPLPTPPEPAPSWQECSCGKRGFLSAKAARLASATNGLRIRVYQCSEDHRLHHVTKSKKVSRRKRKKYRERRAPLKRKLERESE